MVINEYVDDLFAHEIDPKTTRYVQCISSDLVMNAGIAVEFNRRFNTREKIRTMFLNHKGRIYIGSVIRMGRVYNLITKTYYYQKPTYESMEVALKTLRKLIEKDAGITRLAMPRIGCGLDKLHWLKVRNLIVQVFNDMDITIDVYSLS